MVIRPYFRSPGLLVWLHDQSSLAILNQYLTSDV